MKNIAKKLLLMTTVVLSLLVLLAGCGNGDESSKTKNDASDTENTANTDETQDATQTDPTATEHVIAVAIPDYSNAQMNMYKRIYNEQIAGDFNVKFIFSEALNNDIAAEMQFMENAKNSGAEGYISFNISTTAHAENIIAKANEMELYVATNGTVSENVNTLEYVTGGVDASAAVEDVAKQFGILTNILVGDGENHNIVLATMGAAVGSVQHIQSTIAALEAVKDQYDLSYALPVEEIATISSVTEIETGSDIKITIIPGPTPAVAADVEQVLKGGEYDVLICVGPQYSWYESVIKSVEDNLNMDVKTSSIMGISESTATSFNTKDITGNPSLNAALLKNSSVADQLFVLVYNAMTGDSGAYKENGLAKTYPNVMWLCDSPETYESLSKVDSEKDLACFSADEMKAMMTAFGNTVTADDFWEWCESADSQSVLTKLTLK